MGACKTYGLQQPHPYFNRPDLITYAIASSKDMVPIVAKYSGISEDQIVPTGLPRTDAYFIKPQKSDKRNYLYAPTFRAWGNWWAPEWGGLNGQLNDDEEFIVKPHMITKRLMTDKKWAHITEIDSMIPTTEYLLRADVLVTDYSSIMFDAFVMRTPVVLFAKDRMKYLRERGLYHSYPEWYSDYLCETEDDLVRTIRQAEWTPHMEELREYHAGACDGRSTERCIELIRSMI
jgi:CDP-ribitol ribitolphosphotransferase